VIFGILLLPVAGTFRCPAGWRRNGMAGLSVALLICGLGAIVLTRSAKIESAENEDSVNVGWALFGLVMIGAAASTWATNIFSSQEPRR